MHSPSFKAVSMHTCVHLSLLIKIQTCQQGQEEVFANVTGKGGAHNRPNSTFVSVKMASFPALAACQQDI